MVYLRRFAVAGFGVFEFKGTATASILGSLVRRAVVLSRGRRGGSVVVPDVATSFRQGLGFRI